MIDPEAGADEAGADQPAAPGPIPGEYAPASPARSGLWHLSARRRMLLAALITAVPALIVYGRTLMRDVGFWDTAEFQAIGPVLGTAHPTGYPAYTLLAWLASVVLQPFGNEALRANLLSALLVAGGCAVVAATVAYLTRRLVVGVGTGLALALCTEAWGVGLHADPHALHLFLVAVLLLALVTWGERVKAGRPADRWLVAAAVVFGVSLANHGLTVLLAPGIAIYVFAAYPQILGRPKLIVACAGALAITTVALYAYLPIRSAMNPPMDYANPQTWEGFRYVVFAEQFRGEFQALPSLGVALQTIISEEFNQLGLLFVLSLFGVIFGARRRPALVLMLITWFVVSWLFALGYINADISRYYLVPLMAAAVLGGLGAAAILEGARNFINGLATRRRDELRLAVAGIAAIVLIVPPLAAVPRRIASLDESYDSGSRPWVQSLGASLPPDSVIVSWWSFSTALWYAQYVDHWRPDISIIDDRTMLDENLGTPQDVIDSYLGQRPVYLIRLPYDLGAFQEQYDLQPVAGSTEIWEVRGRRTADTARVGTNL